MQYLLLRSVDVGDASRMLRVLTLFMGLLPWRFCQAILCLPYCVIVKLLDASGSVYSIRGGVACPSAAVRACAQGAHTVVLVPEPALLTAFETWNVVHTI